MVRDRARTGFVVLAVAVFAIAVTAASPGALGAPGVTPDTIIDAGPTGPGNDPSPSFSYHSTEPNSTFECSIDQGTPAFGPCSASPVSHLDDGSYTFRVRATDEELEIDPTPATRDFTVDTVPPETFIDSAPSGDTLASELAFTFHASETGSKFECSTDTGTPTFEACKAVGDDLETGAYTFRVRATDPASNVDPSPATSAFVLVDPPPVYAKTIDLEPVSGTVRIKPRGKKKFVVLGSKIQVGIGAAVDAENGKVRLVAAKSKKGALQTADVRDGRFTVEQPPKGKPITVLDLDSDLGCAKAASGRASASRSKKNRLWGSGKGNYRTEGNNGSATVRGTIWMTEDRCDGTLFRVARGVVSVDDFTTGKIVTLRKGMKYLAAAP